MRSLWLCVCVLALVICRSVTIIRGSVPVALAGRYFALCRFSLVFSAFSAGIGVALHQRYTSVTPAGMPAFRPLPSLVLSREKKRDKVSADIRYFDLCESS